MTATNLKLDAYYVCVLYFSSLSNSLSVLSLPPPFSALGSCVLPPRPPDPVLHVSALLAPAQKLPCFDLASTKDGNVIKRSLQMRYTSELH